MVTLLVVLDSMREFSWDVKYVGVQTLVAKFLMQGKAGGNASVFEKYQEKAESFRSNCLGKGSQNVQKTPSSLIFHQRKKHELCFWQCFTNGAYLLLQKIGYATWFSRKASNPNLLVGAVVGGPDAYDNFADRRDNYQQTEPATYNNAPLFGLLARLSGGHGEYNQLLPAPKLVITQPKPTPQPKVTPAPGIPRPLMGL
nr:endoglucanase 6 [Quercus suber]